MKKEELIKRLSATLSVARIAKEKEMLQSHVIMDIDREDKEMVELHGKYSNEFLGLLRQL